MPTFNTSGTTGKPKRFVMTEEQIAARNANTNDGSRGTGFESIKSLFIDFSPDSVMGLPYSLMAKERGIPYYFPKLGNPAATVEFFKEQKISGIVSTPTGLYNYAIASNGSHMFDYLYCCTAKLTAHFAKTIRENLGANVWTSYATSETGVVAIASGEQVETIPNCAGKIVPNVNVRIVDGEIVVQSPGMLDHYEDNPELTAQNFKDGWYYTGDLGRLDGDILILQGRKKF